MWDLNWKKFSGLTLGNKFYSGLTLLLAIALMILGIILFINSFDGTTDPNTGKKSMNKGKLALGLILFVAGALSVWWSYSIYDDPKRQKKCNAAMWSEMSILFDDKDFVSAKSNLVSLCDAQIYAQYNDKDAVAFILKKVKDNDFDYMRIGDKKYKVSESKSSTGYTVYYKKDAELDITYAPSTRTPGTSPGAGAGGGSSPGGCGATLNPGCGSCPFTYCGSPNDPTNIQRVYVQNNCPASDSLLTKFGLTNTSAKVTNCSSPGATGVPSACNGITVFPTVVCNPGAPGTSPIQGYCP